jgi:hypothetical protein
MVNVKVKVNDGWWKAGGGKGRLRLAPSDLTPPVPATASGDLGYPLVRGDSRLRDDQQSVDEDLWEFKITK